MLSGNKHFSDAGKQPTCLNIILSSLGDSAVSEKTSFHVAEETDDDLMKTPPTHTTEDLFTIIHRCDYTPVAPQTGQKKVLH